MTGPIESAIVDGVDVSKSTFRNTWNGYVVHRFADADALRAADAGNINAAFVDPRIYVKDASDTTTADDGSTCIRDLNSVAFKYAAVGIAITSYEGEHDAGTTYGLGALVSKSGYLFASARNGNTGNAPDTTPGDTVWWMYIPTIAGASVKGTSTTSLSIGTGSKVFTTESGLAWGIGTRLRAASDANPTTHYMEGVVTDYTGTSLTVSIDNQAGSGSRADWTITIAGDVGSTGDPGSDGDDGADGVDGASALTVVKCATTANVDLSADLEAGDTVDGVTLAENDLVLVKSQSAAEENGVYVVPASGAASRATAFDTYDEHPGRFFSVMEGSTNADKLYQCTSNEGGTLDTTGITISEFSSGGGGGGTAEGFGRVRCVATGNVTIASELENGDTVDGVTLSTGDEVLLTGQSTASQNGVYTVVASGAASRSSDFNTWDSLAGTFFSVMEGTDNADSLWHCTSNSGGTLDTSDLAISEFVPTTDEDYGLITGSITSEADYGSIA